MGAQVYTDKVLYDVSVTRRIVMGKVEQKQQAAASDTITTSRASVFDAILQSRRSVHAFTDRPVEERDMESA